MHELGSRQVSGWNQLRYDAKLEYELDYGYVKFFSIEKRF